MISSLEDQGQNTDKNAPQNSGDNQYAHDVIWEPQLRPNVAATNFRQPNRFIWRVCYIPIEVEAPKSKLKVIE